MFKQILSGFLAVLFATAPIASMARQLTPSEEALLLQILLEQIQQVQEQRQASGVQLGFGSRGAEVRELQQFLVDQGAYPEAIVSGYYGSLTERAVQRYKSQNGLGSTPGFNTSLYNSALGVASVDNFYVEVLTNSLARDSFTSQGSVALDMQADLGTDQADVVLELDFDISMDLLQQELDVAFEGDYDIDYSNRSGDYDYSGSFDIRTKYKDETLYLYIDGLPKELLPSRTQGRWIEVDIAQLAEEEGFDIDEIWGAFEEGYQLAQDEYLEEVLDFDFIEVSRQGDSVRNYDYYEGEQVTEHQVQFDINKFISYVVRTTEEQYAQYGWNFSVSEREKQEMRKFFGPLFDDMVLNIYLLDKEEVVGSSFALSIAMNEEGVFDSVRDINTTEEYLTVDVSYEDTIYNINEGIDVDAPDNTMDIEEFIEIVEEADDTFYAQSQRQAEDTKKVSDLEQLAVAMELARNQVTGQYVATRNVPTDELSDYLWYFDDGDIRWESNVSDPSRFCAWSQLSDAAQFNYFAVSESGSGYQDTRPILSRCVRN